MLSFCFSEQTITSCCKGIICPTLFVLKNNIPAQTFSPWGISSTTQVDTNPFLMQTGPLTQEVEQSIPLKRMILGPLKRPWKDWTGLSFHLSSYLLAITAASRFVSDKCGGQNSSELLIGAIYT